MSVLPSDWLTGCPVESRGLERQFSLGVWREHTHLIYVIRIVHKLPLKLIYVHYTTRNPAIVLIMKIM